MYLSRFYLNRVPKEDGDTDDKELCNYLFRDYIPNLFEFSHQNSSLPLKTSASPEITE
jgi:hypothetical protein